MHYDESQDSGTHLWVDHVGGVRTSYNHLYKIADHLGVGSRVQRGQLVGYAGDTGNVGNFKHLHFGIWTMPEVHGVADIINVQARWYRAPGDEGWEIRVPLFDPKINYPSDVFIFPVDCNRYAEVMAEKKTLEPSDEEDAKPTRPVVTECCA